MKQCGTHREVSPHNIQHQHAADKSRLLNRRIEIIQVAEMWKCPHNEAGPHDAQHELPHQRAAGKQVTADVTILGHHLLGGHSKRMALEASSHEIYAFTADKEV